MDERGIHEAAVVDKAFGIAELGHLTLQTANRNSDLLEKILVILQQSLEVTGRIEERQIQAMKKNAELEAKRSL